MDKVLTIVWAILSISKFGLCVDPIVEISEPAVVAGVKDIQARKGKDVDLVCVVQNKPLDTNVMWLQQSDEFLKVLTTGEVSEEPQKYTIFTPTSISWRLRIQNVGENDEGIYLCRVETTPKTYKYDTRYVRVVEPPQIDSLQTSSDIRVLEGKELSLTCEASGQPQPAIIWTRLANADLPSGGKELRKSLLYEPFARPEHRGKYICSAENVAGEEVRIINVQVLFHPRATADDRIVGQAVGYKKELFCDIEAYPEPDETQVGWTGPAVSDRDPNFEITFTKGANNHITTKLTIKRVRMQDFGDYICSGTNNIGDGDFTIKLIQSDVPVPDRTGVISGSASPGYITLLTLLMVFSVWLLHGR